jgi:S-adenosylmethionine:tRNA ribosyltransferase-isomerase
MYAISDYDYALPEALISQAPAKKRDRSRLLALNRKTGAISHSRFSHMTEFLMPGDVMVINNTRVIPGRLLGRKETGGRVEVLLLNFADEYRDRAPSGQVELSCLVKASKQSKPGTVLRFDHAVTAEIVRIRDGRALIKFFYQGDLEALLNAIGRVPLPPYIKREEGEEPPCDDFEAYQTVYAEKSGAIAAPTAGLHFTETLLEKIKAAGVDIAAITLHVGYGTFSPVRVKDIRQHHMHQEGYYVSAEAAGMINRAREKGGRVIAVGTTSVRTLEHMSDPEGFVSEGGGQCGLFIYPGYRFKIVDAMITNFHLPKSTLLMLVSAFAGRENVLNAYAEAVREKYRFYSYGDAMVIA